jgi:hypothetical protein
MDIYWMKEQVILDKINAHKQEQVFDDIELETQRCHILLTKSKEQSYRQSIKSMHDGKHYYRKTDELSKKQLEIGNNVEPLRMKIFSLGNDFVQLLRSLNFCSNQRNGN